MRPEARINHRLLARLCVLAATSVLAVAVTACAASSPSRNQGQAGNADNAFAPSPSLDSASFPQATAPTSSPDTLGIVTPDLGSNAGPSIEAPPTAAGGGTQAPTTIAPPTGTPAASPTPTPTEPPTPTHAPKRSPLPEGAWVTVVDDQFNSGGLPGHWALYDGPYGSGPHNCAAPSHVTVSGGVLHLLMSYERAGTGSAGCGPGWYTGGLALNGVSSVDQQVTVRFRVVRSGATSHYIIPMRWPDSDASWPAGGEEDYCEADDTAGLRLVPPLRGDRRPGLRGTTRST